MCEQSEQSNSLWDPHRRRGDLGLGEMSVVSCCTIWAEKAEEVTRQKEECIHQSSQEAETILFNLNRRNIKNCWLLNWLKEDNENSEIWRNGKYRKWSLTLQLRKSAQRRNTFRKMHPRPCYSLPQTQAESHCSLERVNKQLAGGEENCLKVGVQAGLWDQPTVNLPKDEGR